MTPAPGPGKSPRSVTPAPDTCPAQNPGKTPVKPFFPRSQPRCLFPAALWMLKCRTGALGDLGTHTQRGLISLLGSGRFLQPPRGFFFLFFLLHSWSPSRHREHKHGAGGREGGKEEMGPV